MYTQDSKYILLVDVIAISIHFLGTQIKQLYTTRSAFYMADSCPVKPQGFITGLSGQWGALIRQYCPVTE